MIALISILSGITTFEEFEKLKISTKIFEDLVREIINKHGILSEALQLFADGTNVVFAHGDNQVIKIFPPFHLNQYKSEILVLKHLQGKLSVKTPEVLHSGNIEGWSYIIMTKLCGTPLEQLWDNMNHDNKLVIIKELGNLIKEVHSLPTEGLEEIDCHWEQFIKAQVKQCLQQHKSTGLLQALLEQLPAYLAPLEQSLKRISKLVILTGEYTPMNFLVKQKSGT